LQKNLGKKERNCIKIYAGSSFISAAFNAKEGGGGGGKICCVGGTMCDYIEKY
jgi:hypothetical protein